MNAADAWHDVLRDWSKHLTSERKAVNTIRLYTHAAGQLRDRIGEVGDLPEPWAVQKAHIVDFMAHLAQTRSASTANMQYRALQQLFGWLIREGETDRSPMETLRPPHVPEIPVPVITQEQLRELVKGCEGTTFVQRRDNAIIRVLVDTGGRRGEVAGLRVPDVDLDADLVHVVGKSSRPRALPIGHQTGLALGRYLRARAREKWAARTDALWLAEKNRGVLLANGIEQMLKRRGAAVGIPGLHAHMFRHTLAHEWRVAGGGDTELMRLMGWRSPAMLHRYASSAADQRAREAHKRLGLGDRL